MQQDQLLEAMTRRYERYIERLRQQDANAAAEEFGKMCHWLQRSNLKISTRALAGFAEGWIDIFWQCRRHDLMLKAAEDAEALLGADPEWTFAKGEALFNLGRFDEARTQLESLTTDEFDDPMLFFLLACLAERRGDDEAARRLFETAHRLSPTEFSVPIALGENEVLDIYQQCLAELPDAITWHLKSVPIFVSPLPSDELIRSTDPPIDPLTLGLFSGLPNGAEESSWPSDQPRILLFHKNVAKIAGNLEALDEELRRTLFHEVGHFLGYNEDQLEEMGLG